VYPSAPAYIENPKMLVMPYGHGGVRSFTGCGPANEIRGTGNTSFNTCSESAPRQLGTFEFWLR
jgi:hypothetical protein